MSLFQGLTRIRLGKEMSKNGESTCSMLFLHIYSSRFGIFKIIDCPTAYYANGV